MDSGAVNCDSERYREHTVGNRLIPLSPHLLFHSPTRNDAPEEFGGGYMSRTHVLTNATSCI